MIPFGRRAVKYVVPLSSARPVQHVDRAKNGLAATRFRSLVTPVTAEAFEESVSLMA
jgi:hypothetical protein